jgi:hypothetical protein
MMRLDGDEVCGLYELDADRREQDIPPHWFSYVSVEDAEATARKARELSGTVHGEVLNVLEDGRMAIIEDPTGALLTAWQPWSHVGAPDQRPRLPNQERASEPESRDSKRLLRQSLRLGDGAHE